MCEFMLAIVTFKIFKSNLKKKPSGEPARDEKVFTAATVIIPVFVAQNVRTSKIKYP